MIRLICGITPEQRTFRTNTWPYAPSETTPSWIRAPPESLMPTTGQPIFAARSMILHIFSAMTSPSEPPKTVKSWLKTHTRRPSIVPWPVTTASPHGRFSCIPNSVVRWRTKVSSSLNEPGSSSFSTRSRAVYLPRACCFSSASGLEWTAAWRSSSSPAGISLRPGGGGAQRRAERRCPGREHDADDGALADLRLQLDPPLVGPHQLPDDGEADARAARRPRARAVAAPEAVEDMREVLRADADPGVAHLHDAARDALADAQLDPAAGVGVAQRVREQVVHDLLDP